jgi:SAM-dependent methyltransferase
MNFVSFVAHGLSAISVYSDVVGVRLLVLSILMAVFTMAGIVAAVVSAAVKPFLGRAVLEVGAGKGNTTRALCRGGFDRWVCLEPDAGLADHLLSAAGAGALPDCCRIRVGTLSDLSEHDQFDTILYMDVLEHIEDDRAELERAARHLEPGGHLIVLAPAHQWLFTPFDESIGHIRRYTKRTLRGAAPEELSLVRLLYMDSVGMLASFGNRLLLKSAMPSAQQIAVWDRLIVPLSRLVDPILLHTLGKSVLGVWTRSVLPDC